MDDESGRKRLGNSTPQPTSPPTPTSTPTTISLFFYASIDQCSHDTAEDNLVLKLVKQPECEWGSTPTLARRTQVASALDELVGGAAAAGADADAAGPEAGEGTAAAAASEGVGAKAAAAAGTAKAEAVGLAPGYEYQKTRPKDPLNSLAFELDG